MADITYVTFMKHAQKVAKALINVTHPALGGVIHRDNYVAVTDSHRMYFAKDLYEGEEKNVNPKTGEAISEGIFPDVLRLIPDTDGAKFWTKVSTESAYRALRLIEQAGKVEKATDLVNITHNAEGLTFSTPYQSKVKVEYCSNTHNEDGEDFVMSANSKYLVEAFALLKDATVDVRFNFYGKNRPFTFTTGNLTVLILPVRT